jgi:hypothetical protein
MLGAKTNDGATWIEYDLGTSSGTWVQCSATFTATETNNLVYLRKNSTTSGTMLFDSVTVYEVTPGCVVTPDDNKAPDGWYKYANTELIRIHNDGGTNTKDGSFYSISMQNVTQYDYIQWPGSVLRLNAEFTQRFAGRTVTLGMWVKSSTASDINIAINDGAYTYSDYHTGSGNWEWLEVTDTVSASVSNFFIMMQHQNASPGQAYFSQPMLVFGSSIGEGNYTRPMNEIVYLENMIQLTDYTAGTVSSNATINLQVQSQGKIPIGTQAVDCRLYGECATPEKYIQLQDIASSPHNQGLIMFSQVANIIVANNGWQKCTGTTSMAIERNDTWNSVQLEVNAVQLR